MVNATGTRSLNVGSSRDWSFSINKKFTVDRYFASPVRNGTFTTDGNPTRDRNAAARDITLACSDRILRNFAYSRTVYTPSAAGSGTGLQCVIALSALNSSVHINITTFPEARSTSIRASTPGKESSGT